MPQFLLNGHVRGGGRPTLPPDSPRVFHRRMPGYAVTPLRRLPAVENQLGLERIWVKDESDRLGLPAFKVLGASWAVFKTAEEILGGSIGPWSTVDELRDRLAPLRPLRLATATDGNHGRAVARVAKLLGFEATIFMPTGSAAARVQAIASEGATVTVIDGSYDEAVERASAEAGPRCLVVSDTSWEGYEAIPARIAEGYETIFSEADEQLLAVGEPSPTHVLVQIGVGALAVAAVNHYRGISTLIGVEPDGADCVLRSVAAGEIVSVPGPHTSIMAGLNCGTPSRIAWPIMRDGIHAFVAVDDDRAKQAMRALASEGIVSGETGASGLAGLLEIVGNPANSHAAGLGPNARVLVLSTEGATDPAFYEQITGRPP